MQSDQTTPPKRIWADPPETFDGMDIWRSEPGGKGVEYILASEHAALIREAEARGMERAAELCVGLANHVADAALTGLPEQARLRESMEAAFTKAAAAIRAAKDTP